MRINTPLLRAGRRGALVVPPAFAAPATMHAAIIERPLICANGQTRSPYGEQCFHTASPCGDNWPWVQGRWRGFRCPLLPPRTIRRLSEKRGKLLFSTLLFNDMQLGGLYPGLAKCQEGVKGDRLLQGEQCKDPFCGEVWNEKRTSLPGHHSSAGKMTIVITSPRLSWASRTTLTFPKVFSTLPFFTASEKLAFTQSAASFPP